MNPSTSQAINNSNVATKTGPGVKLTSADQIVIGTFYELPCGKIARTFSSGQVGVGYYLDDGKPSKIISAQEIVDGWLLRRDLKDFPHARDPILPYCFDLFWDIKYTSELNRVLAEKDHEDYEQVLAMAKDHGFA